MNSIMPPLVNCFLLGCLCLFAGCAQISDSARRIWGSSTTALERARAEGLQKSYSCTFLECYEAVLSLARKDKMMAGVQPYNPLFDDKDQQPKEEEIEKIPVEEGKYFDVFLKDPSQRHIVVMGISGNIDTTEVGIFFEDAGPSTIKIDISSLSTTAKRRVAQAVFDELDKRFTPAS